MPIAPPPYDIQHVSMRVPLFKATTSERTRYTMRTDRNQRHQSAVAMQMKTAGQDFPLIYPFDTLLLYLAGCGNEVTIGNRRRNIKED